MNKLLIVLFSVFSLLLNAQNLNSHCGTVISQADMQLFYQRDKAHIQGPILKSGTNTIIPIVYHIVSDDNGLGGYSMGDLLRLHNQLNEEFELSAIEFYILDFVYHSNSYYYYMQDGNAGNSMFNNENNLNACNVFIVEEAKSGTQPVCGYSYLAMAGGGPNRGGIMLDKDCAEFDDQTYPHEMGHYLNLPHTFFGWEYGNANGGYSYASNNPLPLNQQERVDGSNCSTTGDGFCDTPPDYADYLWNCGTPQSFIDPNGDAFNSDEKNHMSYSSCREYFKPEQRAEMRNTPCQYRTYLTIETLPIKRVLDSTLLVSPPDNTYNLSPNDIEFVWESIDSTEFYLVQFSLNNFFNISKEFVVTDTSIILNDLLLDQYYQWRVKPVNKSYTEAPYSEEWEFKTSKYYTYIQETNITCADDDDGMASATYSGNVSIVLYEWFIFNEMTNDYDLLFSSNNNIKDDLEANSYKVILTNTNGDKSVLNFTIIEPLPIDVDLVLVNNTIVSSVSGGNIPYTYIWSNGLSSINNPNPINGENILYISDSKGCFMSKSYDLSDATGIEEINILNELSFIVLENNLLVKSDKSKETIDLAIYNLQGKLLTSNELKFQTETIIDISNYTKGIYFVKTRIGNQVVTNKMIF